MNPAPASKLQACVLSFPMQPSRRASRLFVQTLSATRRSQQLHTSHTKGHDASLSSPPHTTAQQPAMSGTAATPALAGLPLSQVLRTYLITSISSSPALLSASSSILRRMLESKSLAFNVERNPVLRALLLQTFYRQFCAGQTRHEIAQMCNGLRAQGYGGVILEYALEVLKDAEGNEAEDVATWRKGMLDTVDMAAEGDFVGLKWSGMGPAALRLLAKDESPSKSMDEAMNAVCKAAAARNIALLPAAEESWSLTGFYSWTMPLQRTYNLKGKSVVYNTYQAYLKQTPATLSRHLTMAKQDNFALGVKLVRGAYLASEERNLIHPTIEATHAAYDGITSALLHRQHNNTVQPTADSTTSWPALNVVLATHNAASVRKAQAIRADQALRGEDLTPVSFAQLQGMADEVSCSLIAAAEQEGPKAKVFKCTTWGSMFECLNYLLRRAAENKDAAGRTAETRRAMGSEIWRRGKGVVGLA